MSQSVDTKMEIEDMFQENLISSLSTQDSKNANAISDLKKNSDIKNINCAQSNIIPHPSNGNILFKKSGLVSLFFCPDLGKMLEKF